MYKKSRILKQIRKNLGDGGALYNSAKAAGISIMTLWLWRKKWRRIDNYINTIMESRVSLVEDALYKNALKDNITAQIFFLKNRASDKWKDRMPEEVPHTHIHIDYGHRDKSVIGSLRQGYERKALSGKTDTAKGA